MAYTPPVVFLPTTSINASSIQGNNDALKVYIDGNIQVGDVSTATWVRAPHIMRGTYIPLWNLHEFATGIVRGGTFDSNNITMSADKFKTPYPAFLGTNANQTIEFIPESSFYIIRIGWEVFPKHPPLAQSPTTTVGQTNQMTLGPEYKTHTSQENDAGTFRNDGAFAIGIPGLYRRRAIQNWHYIIASGATVGLVNRIQFYIGANNIVNDYADFNYTLEVYYN
jgi:hypothetical protein